MDIYAVQPAPGWVSYRLACAFAGAALWRCPCGLVVPAHIVAKTSGRGQPGRAGIRDLPGFLPTGPIHHLPPTVDAVPLIFPFPGLDGTFHSPAETLPALYHPGGTRAVPQPDHHRIFLWRRANPPGRHLAGAGGAQQQFEIPPKASCAALAALSGMLWPVDRGMAVLPAAPPVHHITLWRADRSA